MRASDLPDFKDLPPVKGMPRGCAWGLFDKDGKRDQIGKLNLLTPEVVLEAKNEIQTGESVALNWSLHCVHQPGFGRKAPDHKILDLKPLGFVACDDVIHINTQSGSQWDGFRHWAHQESELYYNGLKHEDIVNHKTLDNSIHEWSLHGGLVARAVLIDYHSYALEHKISHPATSRYEITLSDIHAVAKAQGTSFHPADILIIRSGWLAWYNNASSDERLSGVTNGHEHIGLAGNEETITWLWNQKFAAVAGDAIAFEAWPPKAPWRIHDFQLAMWGSPIGELWDLERLSEVCREKKKWSFMLTSAPLNVEGGVASPPNALAIF